MVYKKQSRIVAFSKPGNQYFEICEGIDFGAIFGSSFFKGDRGCGRC
jgi:hypothetical protein